MEKTNTPIINDQLESLFAEKSFLCYKKAIPLEYRIASKDGICATKEGNVAYQAGDAIMTGTHGEQ